MFDDDISYEDDEDRGLRCSHEEYDVDWEGRANCSFCRASWWLTSEELVAHTRREAEYAEWQEKERRREFWRRFTLPIRWPIFRLLQLLRVRKSAVVLADDEIPF